MNLRHLFSPILLFFLLSACSHISSNHDQSPAPNLQEKAAGLSSDSLAAEEDQKLDSGAAAESDQPESADAIAGQAKTEDGLDADSASAQKIQTDLDEALELCELSQDYWQQGELENALEALDRAYALILRVDTTDQPKLIQQKEDLRFMISKRILEIYASRNIVVNGNHNAIPVVINRHVQAEIDLFTQGSESSFFREAYRRSGRYRDIIAKALLEAGLPEELSWLPLIESGFKVNALSRSRALGLWQFIPSTGYKFGLHRNKFVDERMDPAKSTKAAIEYLKELHSIFGDWATVLAAYNCGEGRVLRVIRSQNINYLDNFWDLYERLPRETARYVPRFLATLHVLNNLEKYGLDQVSVEPPLEFETVVVDKQVSLKNVAKFIDVDHQVLEDLNPELRYHILPGDNYQLKVPQGAGESLLAQLDQIPVSNPPQPAYVYHRVRHGETLSVIARRYRTSIGRIMRANNLRRSNFIVAGQRLKIPQRGFMKSKPQVVRRPANGERVTHIVRKGDSLWTIARKYGTTTTKIQELNNLTSTRLYQGQVLTIFAGDNAPPAVDGLATYEVQPGDSPFLIAIRHNMSLDRLLFLNRLYVGSKIYPGQKLFIE
jgi:membrane-bound lytic murein transglycosylase D